MAGPVLVCICLFFSLATPASSCYAVLTPGAVFVSLTLSISHHLSHHVTPKSCDCTLSPLALSHTVCTTLSHTYCILAHWLPRSLGCLSGQPPWPDCYHDTGVCPTFMQMQNLQKLQVPYLPPPPTTSHSAWCHLPPPPLPIVRGVVMMSRTSRIPS